MALTYVVEIKDDGSASLKKIGDNAKRLEEKFKHVDAQVNIFNKSLGFLKTATATALGSVMTKGVGTIQDLGKQMVDSYDSAAKLSQNIGIAADSVLGLRHAAEHSGVGAEAMDKNMVKLSKTIAEAASGSRQASDAFGKMGINVKNADGSVKNSEKVLMEMADAFKKLPDGAQKATLAMDVFGKSGASMVSMLKDGSGALQQMTNEGKSLSGNVESVAEAMEKLKDVSTDAKAAIMGIMAEIADTSAFKSAISWAEDYVGSIKEILSHRKVMRELDTKNAQADLKLLQIQEARLKYSGLEEGEKLKHIVTTQKQIDVLQEKLKIDNEELTLMKAKTNVAMLEKKQNLNYKEERYLGVYRDEIKAINDKREAAKKAAEEEAKAISEYDEKQKALAAAEKAREEARKKALQMYEAETKRLQDWLTTYQNSKRTESEIAEANYNEQLKNLEELNKRKILSAEAYELKKFSVAMDYHEKEKELMQKYQDEKLKAEEAARDKTWELQKIASKDNSDKLMEIELAQAEARYKKENELAQENKIDALLIEEAKQSELDSIREKYAEMEARRREEEAEAIRAHMEQRKRDEEELLALKFQTAEASADTLSNLAQLGNALSENNRKYSSLVKSSAIGEAAINAAQSVLKTMSAHPFPYNIPLAAAQAAAAAVQIQKISSTKMYRGGMIPGSNTLIMANEEGREAILNTRAVRAIGGENAVNELNRGTSNTYNNSRSNTMNINISTSIMTSETFRKEIEPVQRRNERRR